MKKRKVLQLCHDTKGPFVSICAMYLQAFNLDVYEVHTVFLRGTHSDQCTSALQGSTVHFLDISGGDLRGLKLGAISKVFQLCRQEGFELVIAHRYKAIYIAGIVSFFAPFKLWGVAHTHNVFARFGRRIFVEYCRKNITLVGVSQSVADNMLNTCPSIDKNRVHSLPNCLAESTEATLLSKDSARSTLSLEQSCFIFGTIGRLVDAKAHDILLRAYALTSPSKSKLVIIGDGPNRPQLQQLALDLNIEKQVIFAGHITQASSLLKAFDSFVFSSTDEEAFGVAVLEAMMAKLPIICSDAKGPSEALGNTGLIFKQGDINQLAEQMIEVSHFETQKYRQMGQQAYERWHSLYTEKSFKTRLSALLTLTETP